MTHQAVRVRPDTYVDSVMLMEASRAMQKAAGVEWAAALMGTPANVDSLVAEGFDRSKLGDVGANDVVLAARSTSADQCEEAFAAVDSVFAGGDRSQAPRTESRPRTIEEATSFLSGANVAVISVPGQYATIEAHKALSRGLHVLLFSDNVPLEDELALKSRGGELGLLVMGPGAGTAMLGGVGLGFANVTRRTSGRGAVGIAAAAGTGAQEVMSLLDRWGAGISHVIGVGGRDVSDAVGGHMMCTAVRALQDDPGTVVVVVVSKPPAPRVARALLEALKGGKPAVAALIGLQGPMVAPAGVALCATMEEAVLAALDALGLPRPDLDAGLLSAGDGRDQLPEGRRAVRGLYSGGTLCYEAMTILSSRLGPVYSNTPLRKDWSLPAPPGSHVCLDLGEEEFTKGRPHPMIDPEPRAERLLEEAKDPAVGVLLIDIVLGFGAHPDPASVLAPACAAVTSQPDGPRVVAYVLGTEHDPQNYQQQCERLRQAGCMLGPTGATAARTAAEIVHGTMPVPSPPSPLSRTSGEGEIDSPLSREAGDPRSWGSDSPHSWGSGSRGTGPQGRPGEGKQSEGASPRVALVTYSTKSRGGVVHTLHLAEALYRLGRPIHVFGMGDPEVGFYRDTDIPHTIIPPPPSAPSLEERVFRMVDTMAEALDCAAPGKYDILHAQDCIAARAATQVRDAGAPVTVIRTVHHVDDFSTPALIDCQNRSILDPDHVLVVSWYWRRFLRKEYGIDADVITNGVDAARFARPEGFDRAATRARIGANNCFLFLHVGGVEPRKGSVELIEALSMARSRLVPSPVLAVIGSKPFQDYSGYRDRVFERTAELGLEIGRDLVLLEGVGDAELPSWYQAADAFVFPSIKEGWGLAVLEAMAAGLPVIVSDIPVFREYLTDGSDVLMTPAGNADALADAMIRVATDADLRGRLQQAGREVAARFTWEACARQHIAIYRQV